MYETCKIWKKYAEIMVELTVIYQSSPHHAQGTKVWIVFEFTTAAGHQATVDFVLRCWHQGNRASRWKSKISRPLKSSNRKYWWHKLSAFANLVVNHVCMLSRFGLNYDLNKPFTSKLSAFTSKVIIFSFMKEEIRSRVKMKYWIHQRV